MHKLTVNMSNKIILKLFQCFISHVTMSETWNKIIFSRWSYFKIISATLNMLENIHELQKASEIISGKVPRDEIKLFQLDVD